MSVVANRPRPPHRLPLVGGRLVVALAGALALGCGPTVDVAEDGPEPARVYAEAMCEAAERCGCFERFESRGACEDEFSGRIESLLSRDLGFDEACFERLLPGISDCDGSAVVETCTLFSREGKAGEECHGFLGFVSPFAVRECEDGLVCGWGTCSAPDDRAPPVAAGADCTPVDGLSCPWAGIEPQLFCHPDAGECRVTPERGEACETANACEQNAVPHAYCQGLAQGPGVCATRRGIGESCDPGDVGPCEGEEGALAWCDPASRTCVPSEEMPRVCLYLETKDRFGS